MRIVVLGYIVRGPYGGLVWHHLQYVLGLKKLGHDVLFLEDSDDYPSCSSPSNAVLTTDPSYGLQFIEQTFNHFNLKNSWAYYDAHTNDWYGMSRQKVLTFCSTADVVMNLSAVNPFRDWWSKIPARILIDTDPVFTQIRHLTNKKDKEATQHHTDFFSFGENISNADCTIPDDGINWKPTRQPLFLSAWKFTEPNVNAKWTTVMQWDSYKKRTYNGVDYAMKSLSFIGFENLPRLMPDEKFELAIGGATAPVERLQAMGWQVINSLIPTKTPCTYQHYIQQSKGEWSIAKHGYVISNSGWFSERSCSYLASGKPVVVQDTGFSAFLPTGNGLFSFTSVEEAVEALQAVEKNYKQHCKEARSIAEEYFDSKKILHSLLERL
jgi:hypothetical protein